MLRAFVLPVLLTPLVPAQAAEVLALQKGEDRVARDALYEKLHETRVRVSLEEAALKDLAEFLMAASGNATNFVVWTKADVEPLTLRLPRSRITALMGIVQRAYDVRFVFGKSVVLIEHEDEVEEYTYLRTYDIKAATAPIKSFPGPKLGLNAGERDDFAAIEDDEGAPASGLTADRVVDLVRTHVLPDSWDVDGVSITQWRGVLRVRQTERGHRKVRQLLRALGVVPAPVRAQKPAEGRRTRSRRPVSDRPARSRSAARRRS